MYGSSKLNWLEHYSANAEAMGWNPVDVPIFFFVFSLVQSIHLIYYYIKIVSLLCFTFFSMLNTAFPLPGIETVNSLVSEENLTPDWKKVIWQSPWCESCWKDCNATSPNQWPNLTLELPRLPNIEILCWKILFNKPYLARVLLKRYHLNGNIMGFSTQIE